MFINFGTIEDPNHINMDNIEWVRLDTNTQKAWMLRYVGSSTVEYLPVVHEGDADATVKRLAEILNSRIIN